MKRLFRLSILVFLAILLCLSAVCPTPAFALSPANMPSKSTIGTSESENTIVVGGETRDYIQHVPSGYDGSKEVPLVIVLHPHGSSAAGIEKTSGMSLMADKEDFIVVYPEGTGNPRAWNAGFYPLNPTSADDAAFMSALMDKLERDLRVDDKHIYVCGFSNGAFMTYRQGVELSERIAAIAVVEGTIGAKEANGSILMIPNPSRPIPLIAFHGKEDHAVPYNGGDGVDGIDFLSVKDSISFWVRQDGCNNTPETTTSQKGNIVETDYTGGIGVQRLFSLLLGTENTIGRALHCPIRFQQPIQSGSSSCDIRNRSPNSPGS